MLTANSSKHMRILLLGEYSNVHHTLAQGLRALGHSVVVASDGDNWKNYPRDIDLKRQSLHPLYSLLYYYKAKRQISQLRDFDVVQLINPVFLPLRATRLHSFYDTLRRNNRSLFLGAFGIDHYWVKAGLDCRTFRYSDFNIGSTLRQNTDNDLFIRDWLDGEKGILNKRIAEECNGIISGLYEYHASYLPYYANKLQHIPFPINRSEISPRTPHADDGKIHVFIGIQRTRHQYKGTDIMLSALEHLQRAYPDRVQINKAENVPFTTYQHLMNTSDVLLDQLYSYTPAMNALLAMAKGLVVVTGGEPEHYALIQEEHLRPIVNVQPTAESVYTALEQLLLHPNQLPKYSQEAISYIEKHHDHIKVAQRYIDFWQGRL